MTQYCHLHSYTTYSVNNMENIIHKYVEKNRTDYRSLGHTLEDRLKITSEVSKFNTLFSIG